MLAVMLTLFLVNARLAKRRISNWKPYTLFWFISTHSLLGIKRRARQIWMERFGYDEADAMILAQYQSIANFVAVFGAVTTMLIVGPMLHKVGVI